MTVEKPEIFVSKKRPFGLSDPKGGFRVGDYVALIYSDHEEGLFDNPEGVITTITESEYEDEDIITVAVLADVSEDQLLLLARPKPGQVIGLDGKLVKKE